MKSCYPVLAPVSKCYPEAEGRLPTCYSPVRHSSTRKRAFPFDLHVLSTPPAFVLSQNQTLQTKTTQPKRQVNSNQNKPDQSNQSKLAKKQNHPQKKGKREDPHHRQPKTNKQKPPNTLLSSQTTRPVNGQPHDCTTS